MPFRKLTWNLVCAILIAGCPSLFAQSTEFPTFPQARITIEEWQTYFSKIKALPTAQVFDHAAPDQVIVQFPKESVVFIFTAPTHLAYPAVVRRQLVIDAKGTVQFARVGSSAGDQAAYEAWQKQFDELERKSAEEVQQRLYERKQ